MAHQLSSSKCTTEQELNFNGAKALERQADGGFMLKWDDLPVDGVIYSVFERKDQDEFSFDQPSFDGIKENFKKLTPYDRGFIHCLVVRYSQSDLPPDANSNEVCTELEPAIEFQGIRNLSAISGTSVKITWIDADPSVVKGYKIYQGSDFKELVASAAGQAAETTVEGLVPGRQYSFGVRATDEFQRQDRNIRIRSIVMPNR